MVYERLEKCKRILKLNTQQIRFKVIKKLEEMFDCAHALSRSRRLDLRERERWAKVAAYIAQTINGLTTEFDERKVDRELAELERLVNETRAKKEV
jgi:hypothetical protein